MATILLIVNSDLQLQMRQLVSDKLQIELIKISPNQLDNNHFNSDWIFLTEAPKPSFLKEILEQTSANIVINMVNTCFANYATELPMIVGNNRLIGLNMWPTLVNRNLLEITLPPDAPIICAEKLQELTNKPYQIVADRVGMVTPRMLVMLVNEACFTVGEGTANYAEIDPAMRLGVNYPKGPLSWANEIGIGLIYETLLAVYKDTMDERYKISPLLKQHYLLKKDFPVQN